ncbi:MAG: hypothetical protein IPN92_05125 [Chromatiaceae bacterium]|jgi:hypothetical protein|nr:hypothetical protein [Chromatiaceae bacterium]
MPDTFPLVRDSAFPRRHHRGPTTRLVNLGYRCNQTGVPCHLNAGPQRTEGLTT